ncbi:hypothetical protein [Okeania sp. SIO2C2]|nr:hypothetical protein [Okeania sp. SIO2C2]
MLIAFSFLGLESSNNLDINGIKVPAVNTDIPAVIALTIPDSQ